MCLDMRFKPEVEKKMIAKLPDGLITVYRYVDHKNGKYISPFRGCRFRVGINHANTKCVICNRYPSGYHSFKSLRGAKKSWLHRHALLVKFQMRKGWITTVGIDDALVYVTDRIISPSLRDKSAVVS